MWNRDCMTYSQNLGEVCADFSWSLCRLRLKFVQTTAEVSRKYYVLTNLSTHTHWNKYVYSLKCLRVLTETSTTYSHWFWIYRRRALKGRHSCIAQGASPGLIIGTSFFEPPTGAALPRRRANARAESAAPTELLFFCPCLPRVLFVPLALSPPWALQECRAYGTRN